jgi:hypothetical protein
VCARHTASSPDHQTLARPPGAGAKHKTLSPKPMGPHRSHARAEEWIPSGSDNGGPLHRVRGIV